MFFSISEQIHFPCSKFILVIFPSQKNSVPFGNANLASHEQLNSMKRLITLILEDDFNDAQLMEEELKDAGLQISSIVVETEDAYTHVLQTESLDLILSDYNLPDFNGLEALHLANEWTPHVPFVFVTGTIGDELAAETVLNGAWGFVLKNNLPRLPQVITDCLGMVHRNANTTNSQLLNTSKRLMRQIEANRKVLSQAQEFLSQQDKILPELNEQIKDQLKKSNKGLIAAKRALRRKDISEED